ncbi:transmembrane protein [Apis cerana cerana]|uniref:Transmembrane protein n=1 Tax=Apis cerana cerana TaxID=94128 RepID=A0A2A3E1V4_APICC|nr:transmembrane protein [Apis cerana cerana]
MVNNMNDLGYFSSRFLNDDDSQERNRDIAGLSVPPRHCVSARCPCQFIEDHLKYKPRGKLIFRTFFLMPNFDRYPSGFTWCAYLNDPLVKYDITIGIPN